MKLNCDLGEGAGSEAAVMPFIDQANIACGGHAGDLESMRTTMALAKQHRVRIGAHPGYPDLENFGRVSMKLSTEEIGILVSEQVGALAKLGEVDYVKPHGALYHDMMQDDGILAAIRDAIGDRPLLIQSRPVVPDNGAGLMFEAFADRRYTDLGELQPRKEAGSVLSEDDILDQVRLLAMEGVVETISGSRMLLQADSLCVHGDNPVGVRLIPAIREILNNA